jgi:hypothetical protein
MLIYVDPNDSTKIFLWHDICLMFHTKNFTPVATTGTHLVLKYRYRHMFHQKKKNTFNQDFFYPVSYLKLGVASFPTLLFIY